MSRWRKPATHAAAGTALSAAGGAAALFIGLTIGAPAGLAQVAEQGLQQLAQAEPDQQKGSQDEKDAAGADRQPGVDVDIYAGGGGTASELLHVPVVTLYPGACRCGRKWRTQSRTIPTRRSAAWTTSIR